MPVDSSWEPPETSAFAPKAWAADALLTIKRDNKAT